MAKSNEQVVRDFCGAWLRRDLDELMSYFTPDAVYHNVPTDPKVGTAEIRGIFGAFLELMELIDLEVVNAAQSGDVVFTERRDHFRQAGKERFMLPVNGVFELRDGKIAKFRDYFDLATWVRGSGMPL